MDATNQGGTAQRTAAEAGWHVSRYNLSAPVPGKKAVAIANLYKGTCAEYSPFPLGWTSATTYTRATATRWTGSGSS